MWRAFGKKAFSCVLPGARQAAGALRSRAGAGYRWLVSSGAAGAASGTGSKKSALNLDQGAIRNI